MPRTVIGCDLARGWIDPRVPPSGETARIENTPEGVARWAASLPDGARVVVEGEAGDGSVRGTDPPPFGGCDGRLITASAERGLRVAPVDPRRARECARALGAAAKTDRLDARILAETARTPKPLRRPIPIACGRPTRLAPSRAVGRDAQGRESAPPRCRPARDPERDRDDDRASRPTHRRHGSRDRRPDRVEPGALRTRPPALGGARRRPDRAGHASRRTARTRRPLSPSDRLPRRSGAARAGERDPARNATHPGRPTQGPRRPLRRRPRRLAPGPDLIAMRDRMGAAGEAPKTISIAIARQLRLILDAVIRQGQPMRLRAGTRSPPGDRPLPEGGGTPRSAISGAPASRPARARAADHGSRRGAPTDRRRPADAERIAEDGRDARSADGTPAETGATPSIPQGHHRARGPCVISGELTYPCRAGWSSPVARQAHNLKVVGSNPTPATKLSETISRV